jgi:hypothetical protein
VIFGALPCLVFLAAHQWTQFGHPLRSGYDYQLPGLDLFDIGNVLSDGYGERGFLFPDRLDGALMRWTCPCDQFGPIGKASNLVFYPSALLGLYWIYYPPLFPLFGIWEMFRRRRSAVARLGALMVVANAAFFLGFRFQGARMVAPAAFVLLAFSAAGLSRVLEVTVPRALAPLRRLRPAAAVAQLMPDPDERGAVDR